MHFIPVRVSVRQHVAVKGHVRDSLHGLWWRYIRNRILCTVASFVRFTRETSGILKRPRE